MCTWNKDRTHLRRGGNDRAKNVNSSEKTVLSKPLGCEWLQRTKELC